MSDRKQKILAIGLRMWPDVSARAIARELNTTHSAIIYPWGSAAALRDAVACEAVARRDDRIIPMLIVTGHTAAEGLSREERVRYLSNCRSGCVRG